jgi:WD40 repeat protein
VERVDEVVPIASAIESLHNVKLDLDLDGRTVKVDVTLRFYLEGQTLFTLPVWIVAGKIEKVDASGEVEKVTEWAEGEPLQAKSAPLPARLRFRLVNLLGREDRRKKLETKLCADVVERQQLGGKKLTIKQPQIKQEDFSVTVCAEGVGAEPEVEICSRTPLNRRVVDEGGEVTVDLLPESVSHLQALTKKPLLRHAVYLRIEGAIRSRFEQHRYQAHISATRDSLTNLQNYLGDLVPSAREKPSMILNVPLKAGGVDQRALARASLREAISVHIRTPEGERLDPGIDRKIVDLLLDRMLDGIKLSDLDDKERVSLLMGKMVTISATVGEIRALSKKSRKERVVHVKKLVDKFSGVQVDVDVSPRIPGIGSLKLADGRGRVGVDTKKSEDELNQFFDQLAEHFDGRIPFLTGIRFDQKSVDQARSAIEATVKESTYKIGWSHDVWPVVRLSDYPGEIVGVAILEDLKRSKANVTELNKQLADATKQLGELNSQFYRANKSLKDKENQILGLRYAEKVQARKLDALHFAEKNIREHGAEIACLKGHSKQVLGVAYSPDGTKAASCSKDGTIRLWDVRSGEPLRVEFKGHDNDKDVNGVVFSHDGKRILSASDDGSARIWDASSGKELKSFRHEDAEVWCVAFSPNGTRAVSGGSDGKAYLWDSGNGKKLGELKGHSGIVRGIAFGEEYILTASDDGQLGVWGLEDGGKRRASRMYKIADAKLACVSLSPDGKMAAIGGEDGTLRLWDLATRRQLDISDRRHKEQVQSVAFSTDGRWLLSGGRGDKKLCLWEVTPERTINCKREFTDHMDEIRGLAFSRDGVYAVVGSGNTVRHWLLPEQVSRKAAKSSR